LFQEQLHTHCHTDSRYCHPVDTSSTTPFVQSDFPPGVPQIADVCNPVSINGAGHILKTAIATCGTYATYEMKVEDRKVARVRVPKGLLLRRVNNSGDISWHKNRVFISEVFRFEELGLESITPGFYRVFFRDMEIGELNVEELRFRAARRVV
jgi:hypothetical protein